MTAACWISQDWSANTYPLVPGGSAYYRMYLPSQACGVPSTLGHPAWTLTDGFGVHDGRNPPTYGYDIAVIHGMMQSQVPYQIEKAKALGQVIVSVVDDYYYDLPPTNVAYHTTDPATNPERNRDIYRDAVLLADVIVVTTPFLLAFYRDELKHPDVRMIRNGVLPAQFRHRTPIKRRPVLGWIGGIPWRASDPQQLAAWLPDFLREHDLMFHHAGHTRTVRNVGIEYPSFAELVGIPADRITTSPLVTFAQYPSMFTFDIGLIPLEPVPFNIAKSALKGLEYSMAGVPWVAQDLPEYQLLALDGVGRVARSTDDWITHLTELLDWRVRRDDERRNYRAVRERHSVMAREDEWRDLFADLT